MLGVSAFHPKLPLVTYKLRPDARTLAPARDTPLVRTADLAASFRQSLA